MTRRTVWLGLSFCWLPRWVRFSGWLFFDFHHRGEARNTATPAGTHIRRATVWELHPVTSVELCPNNSPVNC